MNLRLLTALLLTVGACGQSEQPTPPAPRKAAEAPERPAPPSAPASTKAAASAKPSTTAEPKLEPEPTPVEQAAAALPSDPVDRFIQTLTDILTCERADDGLLVAQPKTCFKTLNAAREQLIHPSTELAATPEARDGLRARMASGLEELLSHEEPTLVYYALTEHAAYFRATTKTLEALDTQMNSLLEPIAEAATVVRLGLSDADPAATKKKALEVFDSHTHRRVRHAACRHLGTPVYKGRVDIFKRLVRMAKDAKAELLLRSCAAKEAGHVATERQLKALTTLLDIRDIQQAVIVGLQRGLGTAKAVDAYVRWFERNAMKPDALHWTSMHVFLPWDSELDKLPRERAIKVLSRISGHTEHLVKVRTLAIEGLKRLKADAALKKLASTVAPDDAPEVHQALGR